MALLSTAAGWAPLTAKRPSKMKKGTPEMPCSARARASARVRDRSSSLSSAASGAIAPAGASGAKPWAALSSVRTARSPMPPLLEIGGEEGLGQGHLGAPLDRVAQEGVRVDRRAGEAHAGEVQCDAAVFGGLFDPGRTSARGRRRTCGGVAHADLRRPAGCSD